MDPEHNIRAVTFDVGGTLIEPWPSVGHVYSEVAGGFGITGVVPGALNRAFAAVWRAQSGHDYSRAGWQALVNHTFTRAGARAPSDACFDAIYHRFAQASAWRVFDDVRPALRRLAARGLPLGVISNWDERLRPLLAALDLARHFRVVVVSCEAGHAKPAREIFLRAAATLGCEPGSVLHVGDREDEDVAGATAAEFRAILLDRDLRNRRHEPEGRARVSPAPATRRPSGDASEGMGGRDACPPFGGCEVISSLGAIPTALEATAPRSSLD